jgi:glycolate oxidase FAD binding subunit
MNSNFTTFSLEKIQEKLSQNDQDALEILEWNHSPEWKEKIKILNLQKSLPRYLVIPNTKDILSQFMKICNEQNWRICFLGNGSKLNWGKLPQEFDVFVSTVKINKIIEHAVDDLIITVESGIKLADLQNFLTPQQQFLPIDAFQPEVATVGGIVATADAGSWRQRYGGVRDLILGISFLRHDGQEVKAGGKVVKNVAGYDLMKLLTGSYGNLGVITSVTFRLFPVPEFSASILLSGEKEAIKKIRTIITASGLTPTMADLLSPAMINSQENIGLLIRFQSIEASVKKQLQQIQIWAIELNLSTQEYQEEEERDLWSSIRNKISPPPESASVLCKLGILPHQAIEFLANCQGNCTINISTGVGYGVWSEKTTSAELRKLRRDCEGYSGFLTILVASSLIKQEIEPWGYVGNGQSMMKTIKQNFDPHGIFVDRL